MPKKNEDAPRKRRKRGRPRKTLPPPGKEHDKLYRTEGELVPAFVVCDRHPAVSYGRGGFCTDCFAEETQNRVKLLDDGFAELVNRTLGKAREILDLPILETRPVILRGGHPLMDKKGNPVMQTVVAGEILNPIVRLIEMTQKRFTRPEQLEIKGALKHVAVIGAPVDYTNAAKG